MLFASAADEVEEKCRERDARRDEARAALLEGSMAALRCAMVVMVLPPVSGREMGDWRTEERCSSRFREAWAKRERKGERGSMEMKWRGKREEGRKESGRIRRPWKSRLAGNFVRCLADESPNDSRRQHED